MVWQWAFNGEKDSERLRGKMRWAAWALEGWKDGGRLAAAATLPSHWIKQASVRAEERQHQQIAYQKSEQCWGWMGAAELAQKGVFGKTQVRKAGVEEGEWGSLGPGEGHFQQNWQDLAVYWKDRKQGRGNNNYEEWVWDTVQTVELTRNNGDIRRSSYLGNAGFEVLADWGRAPTSWN